MLKPEITSIVKQFHPSQGMHYYSALNRQQLENTKNV